MALGVEVDGVLVVVGGLVVFFVDVVVCAGPALEGEVLDEVDD